MDHYLEPSLPRAIGLDFVSTKQNIKKKRKGNSKKCSNIISSQVYALQAYEWQKWPCTWISSYLQSVDSAFLLATYGFPLTFCIWDLIYCIGALDVQSLSMIRDTFSRRFIEKRIPHAKDTRASFSNKTTILTKGLHFLFKLSELHSSSYTYLEGWVKLAKIIS